MTRPPSDNRGHRRRATRWLALLAVCAAMFAVMADAERHTSPTADEPGHLIRGLAFWWAPDTRLSWPHPPLGQALATLPIALTGEPIDFTAMKRWETASFITPTRTHFTASFGLAREQLRTARLMMALLSVLLAVYLFEWTRRRYDDVTAWVALGCYAANPVVLANASLMTTDFPVAAATLVTVTQLHDYLAERRAHLWGVALGAALLPVTKLSGVLVLALLAPFGLGAIWLGAGRFRRLRLGPRIGQSLVDTVVVALAVFVAINAAYRYHEVGLTVQQIMDHPTPSTWLREEIIGEDSLIARLPRDWRVPLPWTFIYSFEFIRSHAAHGHDAFWFGEFYDQGQPGYFLVMSAIKLPTAMVAGLAAGVGAAVWNLLRRKEAGLATGLLAYFCVSFAIATYDAKINLGIRHALPMIVPLCILAGRGLTAWSRRPERRRWTKIAAGGAMASLAGGVAMAHPRYLADFNLLVGGREAGHRISLATEDWGQDVAELAALQKERGYTPMIYFTYHRLRLTEMKHLGAEAKRRSCRRPFPAKYWVAIHRWRMATLADKPCVVSLKSRELETVINDHIYVYRPAKTRKGLPPAAPPR